MIKKNARIVLLVLAVAALATGAWLCIRSNRTLEIASYATYVAERSAEAVKPRLDLLESGEFRFIYSGLSAYTAFGFYTVRNGKLYLPTDDGEYLFVFRIGDGKLTFRAGESVVPFNFENVANRTVFTLQQEGGVALCCA